MGLVLPSLEALEVGRWQDWPWSPYAAPAGPRWPGSSPQQSVCSQPHPCPLEAAALVSERVAGFRICRANTLT